MTKGPFKYMLRQRVYFPGALEVQAVVTGRSEYVARNPEYFLEALTPAGARQSGWFNDEEMDCAQHNAIQSLQAASSIPPASPLSKRPARKSKRK